MEESNLPSSLSLRGNCFAIFDVQGFHHKVKSTELSHRACVEAWRFNASASSVVIPLLVLLRFAPVW